MSELGQKLHLRKVRFWRKADVRKNNDVGYSRNTRTTGNTFWSFGRLTERAPPKRYIYWSQQLLRFFYSASERGDHQGNTMIPYLS